MSLTEKIVADITAAMKAKESERLGTLRMAKAALMNRKIDKGGELDEAEEQKVLQSLVKQRRDSVEQYEKAGAAIWPKRNSPRSAYWKAICRGPRLRTRSTRPSQRLSPRQGPPR
jgi:hypothetical protein